MEKINLYYNRILYCVSKKFEEFLSDHNANLWGISNGMIDLEYAKQVFERFNYSIEISEISNAKSNGELTSGNWQRTHSFRWDVVYWDNNGNFVTHAISDIDSDEKCFSSQENAIKSAFNYILSNYKKIEKMQ